MTAGTAWSYLLRCFPKEAVAYSGAAAAFGMASHQSYLSSSSPTTKTDCAGKGKIQKRLSSAGRLSLMTETKEHPFNQTILIALVGKPFHKSDFEQIWKKHDMSSQHPRFHQKIKTLDDASTSEKDNVGSTVVFIPTQLPLESHVSEKVFPTIYNIDLQDRLKQFIQMPIKIHNLLWQVEISTGGRLGQSGAIPKDAAAELTIRFNQRGEPEPTESLLLCRGHHALADGMSLAAAFMDLCDEADEIKQELQHQDRTKINERRTLKWWRKLARLLRAIYFYSIGSLQAFWFYWNLYLDASKNPFQQMEKLEDTTTRGERSLSWAQVAPVEEVERVARSLAKNKTVTINDVIISCVSAAVSRQMQEHQMGYEMDSREGRNVKIPNSINVLVPVYTDGGVLKEGETVGHRRMGAFIAPVPSDLTYTAAQRLGLVHESLYRMQQIPALFWSRFGTRLLSVLPVSWATTIMANMESNAAFVVTNFEGPTRRIHFGGREVEVSQVFTPVPPGVPIGVTVSTYAGNLSISVTAEPWAVPDAEKFLSWILDEYKFLYTESPVALQAI